jgi:hypothetical protein
MKTYVIILSKTFPVNHQKAGQKTDFALKFAKGQLGTQYHLNKIHTIRNNYELWEKRFEKINKGEAVLSVRQWTGKPYISKQVEIANLSKKDGIGIQCLDFNILPALRIDNKSFCFLLQASLASNDGLHYDDWVDWFDLNNATGKKAIIHFTRFRY